MTTPGRRPAFEQLAAELRRQIATGELRPGDRLLPESKLAQQAGTSRSTVREAFRLLQQAGVIERASPKIMIVGHRNQAPDYVAATAALRRRNITFAHLGEALLLLEPEVTRLATERCDETDIRTLRSLIAAQERSATDYGKWSALDQEFHLAIAEMSGNPALIIARAPITELLLPILRRFVNSPTIVGHAMRYHHRILVDIEARDSELAAAIVRRHVSDFLVALHNSGLDAEFRSEEQYEATATPIRVDAAGSSAFRVA